MELLEIQAEGSFDGRGRIRDLYGATIACSGDRQALWIGAEVPDVLASKLAAVFDGAARSRDPAEPPSALAHCQQILETGGRSLQCRAGPSYLLGADTRFESGVRLERSDTSSRDALRSANPGNWHPVEWDELLDGALGPWTMAITQGSETMVARVVSICHTPRPITARGAECGVWTDPAFRGHGYAAAVTAAWAAVMRPSGRYLFYSTDTDNRSSQHVARRLSLRLLGFTWRLALAPQHAPDPVHPLCSLRRR